MRLAKKTESLKSNNTKKINKSIAKLVIPTLLQRIIEGVTYLTNKSLTFNLIKSNLEIEMNLVAEAGIEPAT